MAHFLPPEHVSQVIKLEWPYTILLNTENLYTAKFGFIYIIHIYIYICIYVCVCGYKDIAEISFGILFICKDDQVHCFCLKRLTTPQIFW